MDYRSWYVGMRVVCIAKGSWISANEWSIFDCDMSRTIWPENGKIYTIREILEVCGIVAIKLVEIVNLTDVADSGIIAETSFSADEFKPVDETKLDQFRKHLVPSPVLEDA